VEKQYQVLNNIKSELARKKVMLANTEDLNSSQKEWLHKFFKKKLLPVLSPLGLDPAHPFPQILNKGLNFIVELEGRDAFGRDLDVAIVPAPRSLPRIIRLPKELSNDGSDYIFVTLSAIIRAHVRDIFSHMEVKGCFEFRITRNSNLFIDEEEIDDLLISLEGELPSRRYGDAVRLEIEKKASKNLVSFLLNHFDLKKRRFILCRWLRES